MQHQWDYTKQNLFLHYFVLSVIEIDSIHSTHGYNVSLSRVVDRVEIIGGRVMNLLISGL